MGWGVEKELEVYVGWPLSMWTCSESRCSAGYVEDSCTAQRPQGQSWSCLGLVVPALLKATKY